MSQVANTSKISTLEIKETLFYDEYIKQSYPYLEFFINGKSLYQLLCKKKTSHQLPKLAYYIAIPKTINTSPYIMHT